MGEYLTDNQKTMDRYHLEAPIFCPYSLTVKQRVYIPY